MDKLEDTIRRIYYKCDNISLVAKLFRISWKRAARICRGIPKKKRGRKPRVTREVIESLQNVVRNDGELYIQEIRDEIFYDTEIWLSPSVICKQLNRLGLSRKRAIQPAAERFSPLASLKRFRYLARVAPYQVQHLFFVDETGVDSSNFHRRFARAPRGQRGQHIHQYVRNKKYTVLSCIGWNGVVAFRVILNSAKSADFDSFIIESVLPNIPENSAIILDNATIHKASGLEATVQIFGSELIFLPPYSPDLNPIEISYSHFKRGFRVIII